MQNGAGELGGKGTTLIVAVSDVVLMTLCYGVALLLRYDLRFTAIPQEYLTDFAPSVLPVIASAMALMAWHGLYRSIWSFVSVSELARLCRAWLAETAIIAAYALTLAPPMPASFWLMGTLASFAATSAMRFSWRLARLIGRGARAVTDPTHVMVVGAGEAGRELMREMANNPDLAMRAVCAIDDNPAKQGRLIEGVPVVGTQADIERVAQEYEARLALVAMPSASAAQRRGVIEACRDTGLEVRVVPGIYQFLDGQLSVSKLREVNLEDLLGREPAHIDPEGIRDLIRGRSVLVTGGGGSIGSEICRQVAKERPSLLTVLDIYENGAYDLQQELLRQMPGLNLRVLVGSVRDEARVREVFASCSPDVVFHAAAHKHVPLMEASPREAVKNNVLGTLNVARASVDAGAGRLVLISTDKAVNPTNVMGATKRLCEMVMQSEARRAQREGRRTVLSAVRFGNVLGSNGSVVPLFERQIAEGGPVTVTDPRITRYFMTIPEAVSLVLQSACYAEGGEIFVLDMGEPVRIDDMARELIRLSGHEPGRDIEVVYTGLRPGEKLYEERLMDEEGLGSTPNPLISVAEPMEMDDASFAEGIKLLASTAAKGADGDIRACIAHLVPTFHPELGGPKGDERDGEAA